MFDAFIYGFLALVAGLIISIIVVITAKYVKIKIALIITLIIFVLEIIFLVIANLDSWWR
ncbi:MAG: hypothetical protein R3321_15520 [Nitrososphaeraceae archaeon]|nr:hypothetical protein [Nitrososphaeraceae archaeon]